MTVPGAGVGVGVGVAVGAGVGAGISPREDEQAASEPNTQKTAITQTRAHMTLQIAKVTGFTCFHIGDAAQ